MRTHLVSGPTFSPFAHTEVSFLKLRSVKKFSVNVSIECAKECGHDNGRGVSRNC